MTRVYFIKPIGMEGPIKIGCSFSPTARRETLETWSPFALEIVAEIEGEFRLERQFHALFSDSHQRREWFTATPAINAGTFDKTTLPNPKLLTGAINRVVAPLTLAESYIRSANSRMRHAGISYYEYSRVLEKYKDERWQADDWLKNAKQVEDLIARRGGNSSAIAKRALEQSHDHA